MDTNEQPMFWAVMHQTNNDEMWSNEHGWVDTPTFDLFTAAEKQTIALPIDGQWVAMAWGWQR